MTWSTLQLLAVLRRLLILVALVAFALLAISTIDGCAFV